MIALINIATAVLPETKIWILIVVIVVLIIISLIGYHYTQNKRVEYKALEIRVQFMQEEGRTLRKAYEDRVREERNRFEKELQRERDKPQSFATALTTMTVENSRLSDEVKELKATQEANRLAHFKAVEELKARLREQEEWGQRVYEEAKLLERQLSPEGYSTQIPLKPEEFRDAMLRQMRDAFGLEDVKDLYYKMGIEFNSLEGGENLNAKIRALLIYASQNGQVNRLVDLCMKARPKTVWPIL